MDTWPREVAELTLWIGFHQFWKAHHDVQPPEPILQDTGTLELRDAVLAWDEIVHVPERDRPDPTPRIRHPVTGKLVPDPEAKLPYHEYRGARPAEWPRADFIIGNPPYMGKSLLRSTFGDGYVEALRAVYRDVPEGADYVMYWWHRAAQEVAVERTLRAGLITTNSIRQPINRTVIGKATDAGASVVWAIPDHPWVDESGAADVTVAMTVIARSAPDAIRIEVNGEAQVQREVRVAQLNADLSAHANVAGATKVPLQANQGLAANGFIVYGRGFVLEPDEARKLAEDPKNAELIHPLRNGRDLAARPRGLYVIDFGLRSEEEARQYPVAYDIVRTRVKPYRDTVQDKSRRLHWWRFGRTNEALRAALEGLPRYIATSYVSKHRFFTFLDAEIISEDTVVYIASNDVAHLGVLSSRIHVAWALVAGGRLGVGNDPRYNKTLCFDPFPFPVATPVQRGAIAEVAEELDRHRKEALARDEKVTITGMYNVLEKLRSGEPLTPAERHIHEVAACGMLLDLHDTLDRLVATAYGWPWPLEPEEILERLVALHDERVEEEKRGEVRWLRPEYQIPRFGKEAAAPAELELVTAEEAQPEPWPSSAADQIQAIQNMVTRAPCTLEDAFSHFAGARRDLLARHLETLELMGEVRRGAEGRYHGVREGV